MRSTITYTLGFYQERLYLDGTDAISGFGNDLDNYILGNSAFNAIPGERAATITSTAEGGEATIRSLAGYGNDHLDGWTGNDTLFGQWGNDRSTGGGGRQRVILDGGSGNDLLDGWTGNDSLYGGADNDHLFGGEGYDTLYGDTGADNFFFNTPLGSTNVGIPLPISIMWKTTKYGSRQGYLHPAWAIREAFPMQLSDGPPRALRWTATTSSFITAPIKPFGTTQMGMVEVLPPNSPPSRALRNQMLWNIDFTVVA